MEEKDVNDNYLGGMENIYIINIFLAFDEIVSLTNT